MFAPGVYSEWYNPRVGLVDHATNARHEFWPRLQVVKVKSARLHTRWIIPREDIPRPIGFKFPMVDQRTFKLGRLTLADGVQQTLDFKDVYFNRRPHFLVFHARIAYDDDNLYVNKEIL